MENEVLEILKRLESRIDNITMDVKEMKSDMVDNNELFNLVNRMHLEMQEGFLKINEKMDKLEKEKQVDIQDEMRLNMLTETIEVIKHTVGENLMDIKILKKKLNINFCDII